jgi:hypothetical protein
VKNVTHSTPIFENLMSHNGRHTCTIVPFRLPAVNFFKDYEKTNALNNTHTQESHSLLSVDCYKERWRERERAGVGPPISGVYRMSAKRGEE